MLVVYRIDRLQLNPMGVDLEFGIPNDNSPYIQLDNRIGCINGYIGYIASIGYSVSIQYPV